MLPSVSIIIPVFRVHEYIEDCLASVLAQDYQGKMECILVDDCGEDGSIELAEQYIKAHASKIAFKILHHDHNRKQSAARNTGMREAKGDYINFVDSDDWLEPNAISDLVDALKEHPNCQMVQAGTACSDNTYAPWLDQKGWKDATMIYTEDRQWIIDTCSARLGMIPMTVYSKLYRRDFLVQHHFQFVEGIFHEDEVWLALLAKYLENVAFVHKNLYNYRLRPNSTTAGGEIVHYEDWEQVWLEIFKLFDKKFCPQAMLHEIHCVTSYYYEKTQEEKYQRMILGIKLKCVRYAKWGLKLRLIKWVFLRKMESIKHYMKRG